MERAEVIPKSYPTQLLKKDWPQRKCYYKNDCVHYFDKLHELEVKDDDVWLVTLPKCGTTWMQELLWLLINDCDFETAKKIDLELRTPYLEFNLLMNVDLEHAFKPIETLKSPRLIKSHLPLPLLPKQLWQKKAKVIYVYRHPIDNIISTYYHNHNFGRGERNTLEDYVEYYYKENAQTLKPFEHVTEFYALRNEPWLYYTSFERMKKDLRAVIEDLCQFLDKTINEDQMQQMLKLLSFEEMKKNPMVQHNFEISQARAKYNHPNVKTIFFRKGQANGYKEELKPATIDTLNEWIKCELEKHNVTLEELLQLQ